MRKLILIILLIASLFTCLYFTYGILSEPDSKIWSYLKSKDKEAFESERETIDLKELYINTPGKFTAEMATEDLEKENERKKRELEILNARKKNYKDFTDSKVSGNVAGILTVESVGLEEVVYNGPATKEALNKGVTLLEKNVDLTRQNISMAGHRVEGKDVQFNALEDVKVGDEVRLKLKDHTRIYKFTKIHHVYPTAVNITADFDDTDRLTLITCDSYDRETNTFKTRAVFIAEFVDVEF